MRQLILNQISQIKKENNNFSGFHFYPYMIESEFLQFFDYTQLSDEKLLEFYNELIKIISNNNFRANYTKNTTFSF